MYILYRCLQTKVDRETRLIVSVIHSDELSTMSFLLGFSMTTYLIETVLLDMSLQVGDVNM